MAKLGLVVDLDTCAGCHANVDSATACNSWSAPVASGRGAGKNNNLKRPMADVLTRGEK